MKPTANKLEKCNSAWNKNNNCPEQKNQFLRSLGSLSPNRKPFSCAHHQQLAKVKFWKHDVPGKKLEVASRKPVFQKTALNVLSPLTQPTQSLQPTHPWQKNLTCKWLRKQFYGANPNHAAIHLSRIDFFEVRWQNCETDVFFPVVLPVCNARILFPNQ